MLIGCVGKGRNFLGARRRGALKYGGDDSVAAPSANAVIRIRRDVGDMESAERRRDSQTAAQLQAIGLVATGVAGGTSTRIERCETVGEVRRIGRQRTGSDRRRGLSTTRDFRKTANGGQQG